MRAEPGPARPLILRTIAQNARKLPWTMDIVKKVVEKLSSVRKNPATHLTIEVCDPPLGRALYCALSFQSKMDGNFTV